MVREGVASGARELLLNNKICFCGGPGGEGVQEGEGVDEKGNQKFVDSSARLGGGPSVARCKWRHRTSGGTCRWVALGGGRRRPARNNRRLTASSGDGGR